MDLSFLSLTHTQLERHGRVISSGAINALMLKHLPISIQSVGLVFIVPIFIQKYYTNCKHQNKLILYLKTN